MQPDVSSRIVPRTTVDIDAQVLRDLKDRQAREGKTLGELISELLAASLRAEPDAPVEPFIWSTTKMRARVDLTDKDAVFRALEDR
ncbi:antitoxin VapB48 [soil metagenome]